MKKGFVVSGLFVVVGIVAVFAAVVLVAQGSGFLPRAQSYGSLNISVDAKNVDGKAQISASWKQIPGAEYRYGLYKGSEAVGQAIIPLKTTTSTSFTSGKLDLADGKYTFIVIAGRSGGGFKSSGIKFNGKTVILPHVDRGPDGFLGLPRNLHGGGVNDGVQSSVGFGVDTKTFEWKSETAGTPLPVEENLVCDSLQFTEDDSRNTAGNYFVETPNVLQVKPGQKVVIYSGVTNSTDHDITAVKNVYRLQGNAQFSVVDQDGECTSSENSGRIVCALGNLNMTEDLSAGAARIKISSNAQVGSKLTLKNNLTAMGIKGKDCAEVTLTVVAQ